MLANERVMSVASLPGSRTANDVHENPFASITTLTIARRTGRILGCGARTKRMMGLLPCSVCGTGNWRSAPCSRV